MRIAGLLCFPASRAFQNRVGAYAEIMRIWIDVGTASLMLELFDVYRTVTDVLDRAPRLTHRNFEGLFHGHHALSVRTPADVEALHEKLSGLASADNRYVMAYPAPVDDRHDGSFHTKVIVQRPDIGHCELEFVSQRLSP